LQKAKCIFWLQQGNRPKNIPLFFLQQSATPWVPTWSNVSFFNVSSPNYWILNPRGEHRPVGPWCKHSLLLSTIWDIQIYDYIEKNRRAWRLGAYFTPRCFLHPYVGASFTLSVFFTPRRSLHPWVPTLSLGVKRAIKKLTSALDVTCYYRAQNPTGGRCLRCLFFVSGVRCTVRPSLLHTPT
jgi:hypothetical protein